MCVEKIAILACKQISSNSFKNEIIYKQFTYNLYAYLIKSVLTNDLR